MYSDDLLRDVFTRTATIAVVGVSAKPERPSHYVTEFLQRKGYRVIPVNRGLAGQELFGERVYGSLSEVPDDVDMVDIFRRSEAVPAVVEEALARWPKLGTIWMQIGVEHAGAAAAAEARGVTVIQNRCPKIEYPRLFGAASVADL
ncbi:CoA-binding protein [Thalassorhabdomicrobium marinisediminis]|uniref:CoA-binding protein n=1 Tax=Thalassorhabdomicrobium marinisediminis TaxID=2170577 RepID=A0A2T7FXT8_9RHOB|nr:CoA-binding protein [Thalassorhabdomicrobium marinisediminis]PVA06986.1 CoA-binding protein [Thalassorhabdomicrobium marinisediminis]